MVMTRQQMIGLMSNPINVMEKNRKPEETPTEAIDHVDRPEHRVVDTEHKVVENVRVDEHGRMTMLPTTNRPDDNVIGAKK